MARTSEGIWKASRTIQDNQELPDLPEDLSEQQYADLLFGKGCSVRSINYFHTGVYELAFCFSSVPKCEPGSLSLSFAFEHAEHALTNS